MGNSRFNASDWDKYTRTASYSTRSTRDIFTSTSIDKALDPKNFKIREARDSPANPNSNAIMLFADVTGSMGMLSDHIVRTGMPTLVKEIYDRKPIVDPNILVGAIGDSEFDSSPLQVTQFEADAVTLIKQIEKQYIEGGGGNNGYEGYSLAYVFAALCTSIDCFEKRGKKGYLFTVGDEDPTKILYKKDLERVFGRKIVEKDLTMQEALTLASRQWEIFHLIAAEGSHTRHYGARTVQQKWQEFLGERAIMLNDHTKLGEVIVSIIQVKEGQAHADVVKSWDGGTAIVVKDAIRDLTPGLKNNGSTEVVTL